MTKLGCDYCKGEREPDWIEPPNNGPIVSCPMCNPDGDKDRAWRAAEAQRAAERAKRFKQIEWE